MAETSLGPDDPEVPDPDELDGPVQMCIRDRSQVGEPGVRHLVDERTGIRQVDWFDGGCGLGHGRTAPLNNRTSCLIHEMLRLVFAPGQSPRVGSRTSLGGKALDLVGSSGSRMTRSLSPASGGSPGATAVMTGSLLSGWKISFSPRAMPVAIPPMAVRRRQASKRREGKFSRDSGPGSGSSGSSVGSMTHDRSF